MLTAQFRSGKVMVAGANPAEGSNFAPDSLEGLKVIRKLTGIK